MTDPAAGCGDEGSVVGGFACRSSSLMRLLTSVNGRSINAFMMMSACWGVTVQVMVFIVLLLEFRFFQELLELLV